MTQAQDEFTQIHCPRCHGLMRRPAGSQLYWHTDTNHPRCDVTNIIDPTLEPASRQTASPQPAPQSRNRRGR